MITHLNYVLCFPPKEEMEEFDKLSPDEQQKRLKAIIKKIDLDADGFLTEGMDDVCYISDLAYF